MIRQSLPFHPSLPHTGSAARVFRGARFPRATLPACLLAAAIPFLAACTHAQPRRTGISFADPPPLKLDRPIARPASSISRTNSRITVAVRPLGSVPFDGLTLPLTSPNGRFIAAQNGPTPGWPAVLAEPSPEGSAVPVQLRISAFELPGEQAGSLSEIEWPHSLPGGLLLGRSCTDSGFLVESPRPDGSRWIGVVDWLSGELTWLVGPSDPGAVTCFATFGPSGELAFCRAASPGRPFDLVLRTTPSDAATESVLHAPADCTLACPTFSADRSRVYCFLISRDPASKLVLLALDTSAPGASRTLAISGRAELNVTPSIPVAFQSVLPLQTPWPVAPHVGPSLPLENGLAFVSLETGSMAWFDPRTSSILPLARGTLGAAPLLAQSSGLFLGAARELVYQPVSGDAPMSMGPEVVVVAGGFLPRLTTGVIGGQPRYLLLAPPRPDALPQVGIFELTPLPAP